MNGPVVFFTTPSQVFTYFTPEGGMRDHIYICFKGPRTERYIAGGLLPRYGGRPVPVTKARELSDLMEKLAAFLRRKKSSGHGEGVLMLEKILLLIATLPRLQRAETLRLESIPALADRIAADPARKWDFAAEAGNLRISEVHLRRLFRKSTGISPWHFVLRHRIRRACQLLQTTDLLVKEIAYECGFTEQHHFSHLFCKFLSESPEEFRKRRPPGSRSSCKGPIRPNNRSVTKKEEQK